MHSESKQNKNSTYFLCLAHNYSTGPGPGGHEYNLLPRGYRLSKQQASKFCANSHVAWYMHDWGYTRECLEDRLNSPALESILLLLVQVPSSIYSPCPAFGRDLNTRQRYLWPNKGWHPQLGIRSQSITLQTTFKTLVFVPLARLWTDWSLSCVRKLWKKRARKKPLPQWFVLQGDGQRYQRQNNNS